MAGIAALDELYELRRRVEELEQNVAELSRAGAAMAAETEEMEQKYTRQLSEAARKIESIATAIDETAAGAG
jgi:cell division protein ZapA